MNCQLRPDDNVTPIADVLGSADACPSLFIRSAAAPDATVIAATLGSAEIDVSAPVFTLPPLRSGVNLLRLVIEGASRGDDIALFEDCGDGKVCMLKRKFLGSAPGGVNPLLGFSINAS